ncbi:MAG: hypothetical protein WCO58_02340 [bacterium]
MKNIIKKTTFFIGLFALIGSLHTVSAATDKCISVNPGSSKSANAEAVLTGSTNMNIANFNFNVNGDTSLACAGVTIKKMSFAIGSKNPVSVKNITLVTSGENQITLSGNTIKDTTTFIFPENYFVKTGESVHLSLVADTGKTTSNTSGQLQVYFKSMDLVDTLTTKKVVSPKSVSDDLKLLVLNDVDQYIFKSLSRIRNQVRIIELTGMKGYSFCIDDKNTIPKLLKYSAKNAIDKKTNMCR